ncbi:MAG TPA: PSD1 and planctomycete cytochrome C domain-containing protein [Pirellulales bacterium]|nr:PSD1 and planctomycete cytochrome C domain-containing protein [Pirellulales bacterium]
MRTSIPLATLVLVLACGSASGDEMAGDFFEKKIRPVLVEHCYECHSAESKTLAGNLRLDSRDGVLKGGDSGPAVEPGKPDTSPLIVAVRYTDDALQMPPTKKLPPAVIADLEAWVKMGAPDPRTATESTSRPASSWPEILAARRDWWSLQPVVEPPVPEPKAAGSRTQPVDRFILARLEEQGLEPAPPAPLAVLARRLALVLTGLPPTAEQVAELTAAGVENRDAALERYVDCLLSTPHFGERWARHWMDVVRFTETHGNEWNYEVHHAWRYRDYLIRAFNADLPYDQFVREHIAGDLLPPRWNEQEQFNEAVIGTAFYRFGEVNHDDCISLREIGYDLADNQIDTLTKAFQATTVACARCHDHKLDAVSMRDYYALLGVLRSSRFVSHTIDAPDMNADPLRRLRELKAEIRKELAAVWREEALHIGRYMEAAQAKRANRPYADQLAQGLDPERLEKWSAALGVEKAPLEDPLEPARRLATAAASDQPTAVPSAWRKLQEDYAAQDRERAEFNRSQFATYVDFRSGDFRDWQSGGQGLREAPACPGDFALYDQGDRLVKSVLPAGLYTHLLSQKLNGALRSSVLPPGKKKISLQVIGERSSAVRLVSNNCQLNYVNYRALTSDSWQWVTFSVPDDADSLRTYAELVTMFDNPKFPDQLSPLGGDNGNYKVPWEKAADNPRSYFGVTRVVLHDGGEPPRAEIKPVLPLFAGNEAASFTQVAECYASTFQQALAAWAEDRSTDDDVIWLDTFLRRDLLTNRPSMSPRLEMLCQQYRQTEASLALPRIVPGVADGGEGIRQPVFVRGDCRRPGDAVERRYLEVLSASAGPFATAGSGRLELARRIASRENPLTARVMVNRVWHYLFGTGLVQTVDDFGHVGERPSHPELLDHLATRFMADGWSLKRLVRSVVLSGTFQAASQPSTAAQALDPTNRLLSHYPARRLEAESIRDAILAVSGRLDPTIFGMSVQPFRQQDNADRRLFAGPLDGGGRRSVYIKNNLMESPQFLGSFNVPGGKVTQGRRDVTNVPAQALAMLNDPFVVGQAHVWAGRLARRGDSTVADRVTAMFQTALGRQPSEAEQQRFARGAVQLAALHGVAEADLLTSEAVWADMAHVMFNLAEFVYVP